MANADLSAAKNAKNDEFYTQYGDIQKEVNAYLEYNPDVFRGKTILLPCDDPEWSHFTRFFAQNFENFGLKKLISTSYAPDSKPANIPYQLTVYETSAPEYDEKKTRSFGKIFTLSHDTNNSGNIDIDDLEWHYLEGDGDFRSDEIKALRDEADVIVTNPPFSLFREFLAWIMEAKKEFLIIGNMNAITYKEVFPLIKDNHIWLGNGFSGGNAYFKIPAERVKDYASGVYDASTGMVKFRNCCWFTNLEHGRRHQPLQLMTMADNIKFSKHKEIREKGYLKYDNYDAIEVPFSDAIPSDYVEDVGAPITYPDYNPEEFERVKKIKEIYEKGLTGTVKVGDNPLTDGRTDGRTDARPNERTQDCVVNQDYHQTQENVTALWVSPSASLISTVPNSSKLSEQPKVKVEASQTDCGMRIAEYPNRLLKAKESSNAFSSGERCNGVMGVPISFLDKYCPEQFEILGITKTWFGAANKIYPEQIQIDRHGRRSKVTKLNDGATLKVDKAPENGTYYCVDGNYYIQLFARILIRKKNEYENRIEDRHNS